MKNKVSVIVPVFRIPEDVLKVCVNSLIKQTYKNIEVFLVDDGSPDNCGIICDSFALLDERIKVIHKENGGVSSARNVGLEKATGDYILFVDADDSIHQQMIEILVRNALKHDSDIVICSYRRFYSQIPKEEILPATIESKLFMKEEDLFCLRKKCLQEDDTLGVRFNGAPWCKLYKRDLLQHNSLFFDLSLIRSQDNFFNLQVFGHAKSITYVGAKLYYYRHMPTSSVNKFRSNLFDVSMRYLDAIRFYLVSQGIYEKYSLLYEGVCVEKFGEFIGSYVFHPENQISFEKKVQAIKKAYTAWLPEFSLGRLNNLELDIRSRFWLKLVICRRYRILQLYCVSMRVIRMFVNRFRR